MNGYVELHCHSYYSLLDGASSPESLVARAAELGMPALALTDHDAVYGTVRFASAAVEAGIRPIFGSELTLEDGCHLTLLVRDASGWTNLCWLITQARHNAPKGAAALPLKSLEGHTGGLIALSGCRQSKVVQRLRERDGAGALAAARRDLDLFGVDSYWIELQQHLLPQDDALNDALANLGQSLGIGCVATNNVHYALPDGHRLQDVLVCIQHNITLDEAASRLRPNSEYYLKSAAAMRQLFADYPDAVENTLRIAEQCNFQLAFGLQELPAFPTPEGQSALVYLDQLCRSGFRERRLEPSERALGQLAHELQVIERSGLSNYFLIVWDIVRFACEHSILCQGRGSAANSLVAYLLGISPVNPLEHQLVFERFLSDERQAVPDIDIDFQADRREEVIQYLYNRYGSEHAAMACTLVTFRARSALRDVGKVLGLPPELLERASGSLDTYRAAAVAAAPGFQETLGERRLAAAWMQLADLCRQIDGFPRHLGIHNGGMILMGAPVAARLPTEPATMAGRTVVQWNKDSLEVAGLVKIDLLGLRMLSAIAEAQRHITQDGGSAIEVLRTLDDPAVYALVSRADTIGVFQVESRAQQQVLPHLKPRNFNDLIVSISLIRPGPVQGNMVHPYLSRRLGIEPVQYPHPLLEPALAETLGVVLFQEQVLKVARDLAGWTAGQGEQLRRALGSKRADGQVAQFQNAFLEGAQANGVEAAIASAVFDTLRAFGGYSFPKSHAAAFAVLVYQSAWLKRYHPAAFYTALLNHQPMGFWSPAILVNDAKRHGVEVLPVDINRSRAKCALEGNAIRLGFNYVKGMGEAAAARLSEMRAAGEYRDLQDVCRRTWLPRQVIENLILVGALDGWGRTRRALLWELGKIAYREDSLALTFPEDAVRFPPVSLMDVMGIEYRLLGLSLRDHVMTYYRARLEAQGILDSARLAKTPTGSRVEVAGWVVVHQSPPTAKGFHFVTLEDEHGFVNVIVRPDIYTRYRRVLRELPLLVVDGKVQREGEVVNLLAEQVRGY